MCLGAAIWSNIKVVYYGNTAKDAAEIGFRDDYIYRFIEDGRKDDMILRLEQKDREKTIKAFREFAAQKEKKLY